MITMLARLFAFTFAFLCATSAYAQEGAGGTAPAALGGAGESCRARADCKPNLKCMNQLCTDPHEGESCGATSDCGGELKCITNKCTSGAAHGYSASDAASLGEWMSFKLDDGNVHPFIGVTFAGGFDTAGITGNGAGLLVVASIRSTARSCSPSTQDSSSATISFSSRSRPIRSSTTARPRGRPSK